MSTASAQQDVIDLLLSQHDEIKGLFAQVRSSEGDMKQESFQQLVRLLAVHESAEEIVVHPAARDDAGDAVVEARLHEEDQAKHVLSELFDLGVTAPDFDSRFTAFEQAVVAHSTHEEQEEFPALRRSNTPETLQRMAGAVRAAEAVAPTRPHPGAGESMAGNMVMGPPMAMFDRMRDAVRDWRQSNGH